MGGIRRFISLFVHQIRMSPIRFQHSRLRSVVENRKQRLAGRERREAKLEENVQENPGEIESESKRRKG